MTEERFCDVGRGITLCYETFGDPADPPVLLVMGLATQMIAWHHEFCQQLADRGFHVVRFDNRDIGRSTEFYRDLLGLENLTIFPNFPGDTYKKSEEQLARFMEEVVPLLA